MQSLWPHPWYRGHAEATHCSFSSAGVHCCSLRTPHLFSCTAWLCCCSADQRDTYISSESALIKCFFRGTVNMPGLSQLPSGLASTSRPCVLAGCLLQSWCQDACSPMDSWAWRLKKPVRTLAAMSPAAYCLLLLWERLHLRDRQGSPEHAPVTCRKDLDYNSPAACAAQASWPCANAVDFAY